MTPITRKRALEIAQEVLQKATGEALHKWRLYGEGDLKTPEQKAIYEKRYAELAAALAYIENLARQKELL